MNRSLLNRDFTMTIHVQINSIAYFVKALFCALCHPYMYSGANGSLSQAWTKLR